MAGNRTRTRESGRLLPLALIGLLLAGGAALVVEGRSSSTPSAPSQAQSACTPLTVAVPVDLAEATRTALQGLRCDLISVTTPDLTHAQAPEADLWVPASRQFAEGVAGAVVLQESLVGVPVLSSASSVKGTDSWADALKRGGVVTGNPRQHEASAAVLTTVWNTQQLKRAEREALVVRSAALTDDDADEGPTLTTGARSGQKSPRQRLLLPHPLVRLRHGGSTSNAAWTTHVAETLVRWFDSSAGRALATRSGWEVGTSSSDREVSAERARTVGQDLARLAGLWERGNRPLRALAVLDASGSMKERVDGVRRVDLTADVMTRLVDQAPSRTRMALWSFALDRGAPGQDWVEVLPARPLRATQAAPAGSSQRHRDALREAVAQYRTGARGGTGLFDTAVEAYRTAVRDFRADHDNVVLLLTDGANEDADSRELEATVRELEELSTPAKPVRIVAVAVGVTEDRQGSETMAAVEALARATGGQALSLRNSGDLSTIWAALR